MYDRKMKARPTDRSYRYCSIIFNHTAVLDRCGDGTAAVTVLPPRNIHPKKSACCWSDIEHSIVKGLGFRVGG